MKNSDRSIDDKRNKNDRSNDSSIVHNNILPIFPMIN